MRTQTTQPETVDSTALLGLLADIRAAVGDPTGKLMQDELVDHCRKLRSERNLMASALNKIATAETSGDHRKDIGCIRAIARMGLGWPNAGPLATPTNTENHA